MRASIRAARASVSAAEKSNRGNRDIFLATERPWVAVEYTAGGPLTYDANGLRITVRFRVRNTGKSPARGVWIDPVLAAPAIGIDTFNPRALHHARLADLKTRTLVPFGYTLFPGERISQDYTMSIDAKEVKRITQLVPFLYLMVYGAVSYGFVYDETTHLTSFAFDVKRDPSRNPAALAAKRAADAIFVNDGDIPADALQLMRSFMGEERAD
jgi:hypothetical protein